MRKSETLVMPSNYVVMTEEEMCYLEGGIAVSTVCGIVSLVITSYGASYGAGTICGKRLYYAGINSTKKWSKYKWQARATAVGLGKAYGAVFMLGLENELYDMISGR